MILLLVTHDIDHLIDGILIKAHLRGTNILRDVDRGAIRAKEDLPIQTFAGEVRPYRTIRVLHEEPFVESTEYLFLA